MLLFHQERIALTWYTKVSVNFSILVALMLWFISGLSRDDEHNQSRHGRHKKHIAEYNYT